MSDAITLDVLSSSPVQLDVGDADPIAREEIAALATRVTTVEGNVTALDGRMDTAEGDISTLGTTVDGIDARVEAIEADYMTAEDVMGALGGEAPALVAGSSCAILGDPETASWMERTTAADGAALIESICGNTTVESGSLLPVRMEGIETAGRNLLKGVSASTTIDGVTRSFDGQTGHLFVSGTATAGNTDLTIELDEPVRVPSGETVTFSLTGTVSSSVSLPLVFLYDGSYFEYHALVGRSITFTNAGGRTLTRLLIRMNPPMGNVNISAYAQLEFGSTATEYEPYWTSQRAIPASTYFPDGMRSAGTVYDELTETQAITRVGVVDLGTLTWQRIESGDVYIFQAIIDTMVPNSRANNISCAKYAVENVAGFALPDKSCTRATGSRAVYVRDTAYTDAATFKAAMSGVMLHYALATPTTTPIDPALPLSYRVGAGGTERVMLASGTTSAPPIFVTRYPVNLAALAESIAPRESTIATGNHAIGDLIMLGWTLCKATQVIVTGEVIEIGTNVTRTSVAAEIAALS